MRHQAGAPSGRLNEQTASRNGRPSANALRTATTASSLSSAKIASSSCSARLRAMMSSARNPVACSKRSEKKVKRPSRSRSPEPVARDLRDVAELALPRLELPVHLVHRIAELSQLPGRGGNDQVAGEAAIGDGACCVDHSVEPAQQEQLDRQPCRDDPGRQAQGEQDDTDPQRPVRLAEQRPCGGSRRAASRPSRVAGRRRRAFRSRRFRGRRPCPRIRS